MARKTLLTESEVRRFMKLANMGPVGSQRIEEMSYLDEAGEEAELEADLGAEDEFADEEGADLDALEDEPMDDLGGEEELGGEVDPELEEKMIDAVLAVAKAFGMEDKVSVEEVPGDEGAPEMEPSPEEDVEMGSVEMDMGPEGGEDVMAMDVEEEPVPGNIRYQEALVNKVARRVASRLMQENKNEKLAIDLTERIFNRITSKSS
jgi:hypothetical protein